MCRAGPLCLSLLLAAAGGASAQSDLPPPPGGDPPPVFEPADPLAGPERPAAAALPGANLAALVTLFDPATPLGLGGRVPVGYSALWEPRRPVAGQPTELGSLRQDAVLRLPLLLDGPDSVFGSFGVRHVYTRTDAVFPDSGRGFPVQLWDVRAGFLYRRDFGGGWAAGAGITVSSPSDKPFRSGREVTYAVAGFVQAPAALQGDNWLFTLTYSPVGEVRYPVPGVAYQWNPSDRLSATLGLPLALMWRPLDDVRFDFGYIPLRRVRAQVTWAVTREADLFAGFEWMSEAYLLSGRADRDEQLFYYEKRIPVGVRVHLGPAAVLDLAGGYGFDRFYFAGRGYGDRHRDRIDVGSGAFLQLRLAVRF